MTFAVYQDEAFSSAACDEAFALGREARCATMSGSSSLWIAVRASSSASGAEFNLHVEKSQFRVILYQALNTESIAAQSSNYYRFFQGTTIGTYYEITVVPDSKFDLSWELYENPELTNPMATCNNTEGGVEICRTPPPTILTTYYLVIRNASPVSGTFQFFVN